MKPFLLAALLILPAPLLAQPGPTAPVGDLAAALALPVASELVGARDKARFGWVENEAGERNIWIADAGSAARQLTAYAADDGELLYHLAFRPDGGALAFVRGGDPEYADEEDLPNTEALAFTPRQQLFLADLQSGGAPKPIGEGHSPIFSPDGRSIAFTRRGEIWLWDAALGARRIARVAGEVRRLNWSPDGSRLLFVDDRAGRSFVGLLGLDGGAVRYLQPSLGYSVEPAFSPDGRRIAFIAYVDPPSGAAPEAGAYWSIKIADASSGETRTLWTAPAGEGGRFAGTRSRNLYWSAGRIVFPWEASGFLHAYSIDATRGGPPVELTPGRYEVEAFVVAPDGKDLIYAAGPEDPDRRHLFRVPIAGGAVHPVTTGPGFEFGPVFGGDRLAAIATDADSPAFPALAGRKIEPLGPVATLSGASEPQTVVYSAEDGVRVHAQLFRARGIGPHPALVFVHGGPRRQMLPGFHPSGYYSNAYILNQHFAARGYDVLAVNYRSGTGYGRAFRDAPGIAREGATEYRDVLAGGRWLAARSGVDPKRIGIWGGSWGGYLTALALARNSDLFAAGADFHGVHAMVRPVENNISPDAQAAAHQLQWQSSPMASIGRWRSPVLLVHGDDDRNVPFSQSLLLARELAARGIPHQELVFPNERHGFFRYADWLAAYRATEAFFQARLGAQAAK
jgi:dipeptidyl aminopeptidase/acylaminoacyl peptidase